MCLESVEMDTATFEKDNYIETGMPAEAGELFPGTVVEHLNEGQRQVFLCDNRCALEVTCVNELTVRFRFAPQGEFSDGFSYAVLPESLEGGPAPKVEEDEKHYILKTGSIVVFLLREGLRMRIEDTEGNLLSQDEKGFHWYENHDFGGEMVMMSRVIQSREHYYGLGDVPGHKNLRGQRRQLWGGDVYGYDAETDPLYKNIPFFIGLHHGSAYGIFFDNTFRSTCDFGKERPSVTSFWSQGGEMDFYFMYGPTVPDVVERYAESDGETRTTTALGSGIPSVQVVL